MSIEISAPADRDWRAANLKPSDSNYNSVHLTPKFFSHFYNWWSMFSGTMSLPIRQGKLWPGIEKSSKKFGRHLATFKYSLLLSPIFLSHIYKHKDAEEYNQGAVSCTGLKCRLDSLMLDIHQRREEFTTQIKGEHRMTRTSGMRIHEAQLDLIAADIRAISASLIGTNPDDLEKATLASYNQETPAVDLARFDIPDQDLRWIDMDDFVELDWILPAENNPQTKILPLAYAPRFTYFRQTDHHGSISGDSHRSSPFGSEPTHHCVMSTGNDPRQVQCDLITERLKQINKQMEDNQAAIGDQELKIVRDVDDRKTQLQDHLRSLEEHSGNLQRKKVFLQSMQSTLLRRLDYGLSNAVPDADTPDEIYREAQDEARSQYNDSDADGQGMDDSPAAGDISDFNNRFVVHNSQIKWNNGLRNIILRYIHQVSQRRGFVYYMSRRAVKFILDIVDEQQRLKRGPLSRSTSFHSSHLSPEEDDDDDDDVSVEERIQQLLDDGKIFVSSEDPSATSESGDSESKKDGEELSHEFTSQNTYHFRLIAPQIQLQSEKNSKSAVLVSAKGMELKVIQIMDKDRVTDDVSGLVQRRFEAEMDSLQIYVTSMKKFATEYLHMYSANSYGTKAGSKWPPWVPLEVMFQFDVEPFGFERVVRRTSARLRYEKYNTLRLKYNDDVSKRNRNRADSRIDHLWVDFPKLMAVCNSAQYYAMYIIVLDLLLYSEPLEKTRSERLEKIMLAADFSDLSGAPELVIMLQERIRQLEEIKLHFQINEKYLDRQGWKDRIAVEQDLTTCEDELFFIMKAITTSQRRTEDRKTETESTGLLRWWIGAQQIVWHLLREQNVSLCEFQLKDVVYDRTDNNDGSNLNALEIGRVMGWNLLPHALYPQMISRFEEGITPQTDRGLKMVSVNWLMLEAIAGIPVVDHFELNVLPLRVQLEREIAKKLFEYVFPSAAGKFSEGSGVSPFLLKQTLPSQQEEDEADDQAVADPSPELPTIPQMAAKHTVNSAGLELRLQPTLTMDKPRKLSKSPSKKAKSASLAPRNDLHHLRIFHNNRQDSSMNVRKSLDKPNREISSDSLGTMSRPASTRRTSESSAMNGDQESSRRKTFGLGRSNSNSDIAKQKKERSDDLTQMMNRASNYMTLAYVKVPSVVLCLSIKGKGQRNFEDVHDLVLRMPTLEYRNKTWSNLDLVLQLKRDVIRALVSHTGAIISNKFSRHAPNKAQQTRLREMASSSIVLSNNSPEPSIGTSLTPSIQSESSSNREGEPRPSFTSSRRSALSRQPSRDSRYSDSKNSWTGTSNDGASTTSAGLGISNSGLSGTSLGVQGYGEGPQRPRTRSQPDMDDDNTNLRPPMADHRSLSVASASGITRTGTAFLFREDKGSGNGQDKGADQSSLDTGSTKSGGEGRKSKLLLGKKLFQSLPGR